MLTHDAAWEFWETNKIQNAKIMYENNRVTEKQGIIFVNTKLPNQYNDLPAEKKDRKVKKAWMKLQMQNKKVSVDQAEE